MSDPCVCVYATAKNTPSVRLGYEMGGYLKHECDYCRMRRFVEPMQKGGVSMFNANIGHGHVYPRPDGVKMRCGGPGFCHVCSAAQLQKIKAEEAEQMRQEQAVYDAVKVGSVVRCKKTGEVWIVVALDLNGRGRRYMTAVRSTVMSFNEVELAEPGARDEAPK